MATVHHVKNTNGSSGHSALSSIKSDISNMNNGLANYQELARRIGLLEELMKDIQIQKLQDQNRKLEEQIKQHETRIANLTTEVMNLQLRNSKNHGGMVPVMSTEPKGNMANQSDAIIRSEENNYSVSLPIRNSTTNATIQIKSGNSVGSGNFVFARWMNSRDTGTSLWSDKNYRSSLLKYIGKTYEEKYTHVCEVLDPLRIEHNHSDELDQLYEVIKELEKQLGAKESLRRWQRQTRSSHRLAELRNIFEYSSACSSSSNDWKITSTDKSKKIINRQSIKAYFDMICRDGFVTEEIGEYLGLAKKDILGGTDYDSHNDNVTFVNVNLNESTINLDDNRVDLVTCFVTLHHVPHLQPVLAQIVRILRPGGYLILREHDCKKERSLKNKLLNFIHAFMMIARVGEFANPCVKHTNQNQDATADNCMSTMTDWEQQKISIIQYTNSIQYRARDEWHKELEQAGFRLNGTFEYNGRNSQALYYAIYQLHTK